MAQGAVTTEYLNQEILSAEKALKENEQRSALEEDDDEKVNQTRSNPAAAATEPALTRLNRLRAEAQDLRLAQEIAEYVKQQESSSSSSPRSDLERLTSLGDLLCRHSSTSGSSSCYQKLHREEFLPLYDYLRSHLVLTFRRELKRSNYPVDCEELLQQSEQQQQQQQAGRGGGGDASGFSLLQAHVANLNQLEQVHAQVQHHVGGPNISNNTSSISSSSSSVNVVLVELCRPFVERVSYHFVEQTAEGVAGGGEDRPTTLRTDRLIEWLLNFCKEHVFQSGGAWELVYYSDLLTPNNTTSSIPTAPAATKALQYSFLNEVLRLLQWVVSERNFFRHPQVAGPNSNPLVLCTAVEQLLQFDSFVRTTLVPPRDHNRIISLVDVCVAGDEELLGWWLERERESVVSQLFAPPDDDDDDSNATAATTALHRTSPRAELFCALVRSIHKKASCFTFSGPYLSHVLAPLCVHFLDALHASSNDLSQVLKKRGKLPTDAELAANVASWIELINGAHMASTMLATHAAEANSNSGSNEAAPATEDLARFGRSLERLQSVILDEFCTTVVEIFLMEKTKMAGYLMRCSYLLSSSGEEVDAAMRTNDVSPDLQDTQRALAIIVHVCEEGLSTTTVAAAAAAAGDGTSLSLVDAQYAPRIMHERLFSLVAEKLLEVALDLQGMTPDLLQPGCALFARDANALFGQSMLPPHALRVVDICKLMSLPSAQLCGMGGALCGLSGRPAPLTEAIFEADDRLFEEAISMIRAKGFVYLELADVFAVLNRRRDL